MKKVAQKRILPKQKKECSVIHNSAVSKQKQQTLQDISHHLQQIGMKVMGVCVTEKDDLSFLKVYSHLSAAQATRFSYKIESAPKSFKALSPKANFMDILPNSFQSSVLPN
jgi:hypothetical protein